MNQLKPAGIAVLMLGVLVLTAIMTWAFGIYQTPEMIFFLKTIRLCG